MEVLTRSASSQVGQSRAAVLCRLGVTLQWSTAAPTTAVYRRWSGAQLPAARFAA